MQKDSLSLIERGRRFPHPEHFMLLVERYGVTGYSLGDFFDQKTSHLLELKNRILSAMCCKELGLLPELLFRFREAMEEKKPISDSGNIFSQQFFQYANGWFDYASGGDPQLFLTSCITCLRLTQPHFGDTFNATDAFLNQNELMILNSIACLYALLSQNRQALILFEQMIIKQKRMIASHPIHYKNLICLYHNAALLEWEVDLLLSEEHIRHAKHLASQYGGVWTGCRVWRSELQIIRHLRPSHDLTDDLWGLKAVYTHFRPKSMVEIDFDSFMEKQEFLELF